jgi:hypothetical protein
VSEREILDAIKDVKLVMSESSEGAQAELKPLLYSLRKELGRLRKAQS